MRVHKLAVAVSALVLELVSLTADAHSKKYQVLYIFSGDDGAGPTGNIVLDNDGNIYGTTEGGGPKGSGAIFKLTPDGKEEVLHSFDSDSDGSPPSGILRDPKKGLLYGTASEGGLYGYGTLYRFDPAKGSYTVLHSFRNGGNDGLGPGSTLSFDKKKNLYGTTPYGGAGGGGTIFELNHAGDYSVLYAFGGHEDGDDPDSGLSVDKTGNLYGTTSSGGAHNGGIVFEMSQGSGLGVLHAFDDADGGANPYFSRPIRDKHGNVYGTTIDGGSLGFGLVYEVSSTGQYTVLHSFGAGSDGQYPYYGLTFGKGGQLYGTTHEGGRFGMGTVFRISRSGEEKIVHSFAGGKRDGSYPHSELTLGEGGILFGTTHDGGGNCACGTVFEIKS